MTKRIYDTAVVAVRLKKLRHEKGLTQKELAEKLYWSESTIKQYECGGKSGRIPGEHNLSILADFFKVEPGYILGTQDYKTEFAKRWADIVTPEALAESQRELAYYDVIARILKEEYHLDLNEYSDNEASIFFTALDDMLSNLVGEFRKWADE